MIRLTLLLLACASGSLERVADGVSATLYVSGDESFHHDHPAQVSEEQLRAALLKDGTLIGAQIDSLAAACVRELARLGAHQQLLFKSGVELALFVEGGAIVVGRWQNGALATRTRHSIAAPPPSEAIVIPMPAPARGEDGSDRARARVVYDSAIAHYNLGEFKEAVADFKNAYRLVHEAALLFNIAQCHRMLREYQPALEMYRAFRREAPDSPNRADVERRIHELEEATGGGR